LIRGADERKSKEWLHLRESGPKRADKNFTSGGFEEFILSATERARARRELYRFARIHYPGRTMWNVEEKFSPKAIESLAALGFAVGSTRGVVRVEKYGCGAEFRKGTDGTYQMTILPTIMLKGQFTRLWDAGYQKFLLTDDGQKVPALAQHLQNLRKFNEELRTALGVPTFYNEALGSVSQVSVYDRVKGRKGDVPDETVGAHSESDGH